MLRWLSLSVLILLAGPAVAQVTGAIPPAPNPKLKDTVYVSTDLVRIGDLVDNAGPAANIPVFRSPDVGYTGGVPLARVMEALAPYRIARLETGTITEVTVTRTSRAITPKEIEARIVRALASRNGFGDPKNITITFDRDLRTIHVEPTATEELQITRLSVEPRTGRFLAVFDLPSSVLARRIGLRFTGTAIETAEVTVVARSLNRGEIVKSSDLTTERRPKGDIAVDALPADAAVGLAVKRPLRVGTMLRQDDVAKPDAVQRNDFVTIVYEAPGFVLTARGKATEAGSVGDIINVLNTQSNRTVQATIVAPGRVSVAASPRPAVTSATVPNSPSESVQ